MINCWLVTQADAAPSKGDVIVVQGFQFNNM
jgi:hypothetical protein